MKYKVMTVSKKIKESLKNDINLWHEVDSFDNKNEADRCCAWWIKTDDSRRFQGHFYKVVEDC